jgi:hypothetical protein
MTAFIQGRSGLSDNITPELTNPNTGTNNDGTGVKDDGNALFTVVMIQYAATMDRKHTTHKGGI